MGTHPAKLDRLPGLVAQIRANDLKLTISLNDGTPRLVDRKTGIGILTGNKNERAARKAGE
jgi:hypothetical protein